MRVLSWFGGILIAVAIATSVGAVTLAHRQGVGAPALTASKQVTYGASFNPYDPVPDPPHRVDPLPPPIQVAAPANPAGAPSAARPAASRPSLVVNSTQQALINQDRAAHGLGPLTWSGCLYNVAVSNAKRIAAQGSLSHTNGAQADLSCGLGRQAGENIGYWSGGIDDSKLNSMFMASSDHYANIMGPYHYVATAWVVASNGYAYIAVEFS